MSAAKKSGVVAAVQREHREIEQLKRDVLAHARQEERDEHPLLIEDTARDELERRADLFARAERNAAGH